MHLNSMNSKRNSKRSSGMASKVVNQPRTKTSVLKKLSKKKHIGTGDGGILSKKIINKSK